MEVRRGFLFRGRGLRRCRAGLSGSGAELNRFWVELGRLLCELKRFRAGFEGASDGNLG